MDQIPFEEKQNFARMSLHKRILQQEQTLMFVNLLKWVCSLKKMAKDFHLYRGILCGFCIRGIHAGFKAS